MFIHTTAPTRFLKWLLVIAAALMALAGPAGAQGQESLEHRVAQLEARVRTLEATLAHLTVTDTERPATQRVRANGSPVSVRLISKRFHPGQYDSQILFELAFTSALPKAAHAFTGVVVFQDLFDRDIMRVNITVENPVVPGGSVRWSGGVDYNQLTANHQRLRSIPQSGLRTKFELEQVIYQDGTRQRFAGS